MLISIVTINRNNAGGLFQTVKSVFSQNYAAIEYIIIDGASADNSLELIMPYRAKINHVISEPDNGIYDAMNKGLHKATGTYIIFLNSGDIFCSDDVVRNVVRLKATEDLIYGNLFFSDKIATERKQPAYLTARHMLRDTIWHPATFYRTELLKACNGYNIDYTIAADYELLLRLIYKHNATTRYINMPVAVFDVTGISGKPQMQQTLFKQRHQAQRNNMPLYYWLPYQLYSTLRK
ncbi:MAG: glycosyltransferase [Bacteroidia bacterium]|nr:glycosyltransferase [Bacteroidia bacterium]HQV00548.1 glycosyltransferase family 2 protein [Bacteroidia bacterium]